MEVDSRPLESAAIIQATDAETASTTSSFVPAARGASRRFANAIAINLSRRGLRSLVAIHEIAHLPQCPIRATRGPTPRGPRCRRGAAICDTG